MERPVRCKYCGADLGADPDSRFCPECGKPIYETINPARDQVTSNVFVGQQPTPNNSFSENLSNYGESIKNTMGNLGTQTQNFLEGDKFRQFCVRRYFIGFGKTAILLAIVFFAISKLSSALSSFGGGLFRPSYSYDYGYGGYGGYGGYDYGYERSGGIGFWGIMLILVVLALIAFSLYLKFSPTVLNDVKAYTARANEILKARYLEKLNVDKDQIKEVEPIIINGFGNTPNVFSKGDVSGFVSSLFTSLILMFKGFTSDPIEAYRLGTDRILRGMLISSTIYAFTDSQVLIYKGSIDISTGVVYDETCWEIFYSDINYVDLREVLKKYRTFLFSRRSYNMNDMVLGVNGVEISSTFDTRFTSPNFRQSIHAMKNLIREKNKESFR